jgi:hypothetical protein
MSHDQHCEDLLIAHSNGVHDARKGVQDLYVGVEEAPDGIPDPWAEKPFAHICWEQNDGDTSVGLSGYASWILSHDQTGTVMAEILANVHQYSHPTFINGYLVIKNHNSEYWLYHPNGDDYNGPFDNLKEATEVAESMNKTYI